MAAALNRTTTIVLVVILAALALYVVAVQNPRDQAAATCATFAERIQREQALSFPEGAPTAAAREEYLAGFLLD